MNSTGHYWHINFSVSCLIFWLAILEKYTENGQWPAVVSISGLYLHKLITIISFLHCIPLNRPDFGGTVPKICFVFVHVPTFST